MDKKTLILLLILFSVISLIFILFFKGVSISVNDNDSISIKEDNYILNNVVYLGYEDDSCYHMVCTAKLKFSDGVNTYKLTGHSHEMENLVINSYYNVSYDDFSKEIKNYGFVTNISSE